MKFRIDIKLISETSSSSIFKNNNVIEIELISLLNDKYVKYNLYYKINIKIGIKINTIYIDSVYLIIIIDKKFLKKYQPVIKIYKIPPRLINRINKGKVTINE